MLQSLLKIGEISKHLDTLMVLRCMSLFPRNSRYKGKVIPLGPLLNENPDKLN